MKLNFARTMICILLLLTSLAACGGEGATPEPIVVVVTPVPGATRAPDTPVPTLQAPTATAISPAVAPADIELREVTFARGLTEQMEPVDPTTEFTPTETVFLSLQIKGRPKQGKVTALFSWGDQAIAEATVDLADVNSGLIFSIGEDTFAGYTLTHDEPFPISDNYQAAVSYDGQSLGSYGFSVVPPASAIESVVRDVVLARGADADFSPVDPTTQFASDETVYLVGSGDLGLDTWLQADWYVAGRLDDAGTRSLTLQENAANTGFSFSYLPEGGWPEGEHWVVLTMNDREVGRYTFTVSASQGAGPGSFDEAAFWDAFPLPEDAELVPVAEGIDVGFATSMIEPDLLDAYATWLEDQGWQQQAPAEAVVSLPHQRWRTDGVELLIEIQGVDEAGRTVVWVQLTSL